MTVFRPNFPVGNFPIGLRGTALLFRSTGATNRDEFSDTVRASGNGHFSGERFYAQGVRTFQFPLFVHGTRVLGFRLFDYVHLVLVHELRLQREGQPRPRFFSGTVQWTIGFDEHMFPFGLPVFCVRRAVYGVIGMMGTIFYSRGYFTLLFPRTRSLPRIVGDDRVRVEE